ncbi:SMI1/KNR4 family protein [Pseudomonas citrulli]|uniref:SMI1/KNR4 family protein n=1 Tax=Pseudomonas citrulli TaxID=3064347 RepID=A0ABT9BZS8_9PSED|nr:SMI1/KNR4 family protein [Pseudomonas sp. K18]MDO7896833.1 SMI1/KNR4 family protein [Pseudomonas sp. K18]
MHEQPDPQRLHELLALIDQRVTPEVATTLRPPAAHADITRIEQILGAPLPSSLSQLLLWHDGQAWNAPLRESDNRRLLAASEIVEALEFFLDPDEEFLEPWGRYWVPFLTNDSGDYVVIDASPTGSGELLEYWHDWENRDVLHHSLVEWVVGFVEELG